MTIAPVQPDLAAHSAAGAPSGASAPVRAAPFRSAMLRALDEPSAPALHENDAPAPRPAAAAGGSLSRRAEEAARQLVASTFIVPMLAAMRESPFQTDRFGFTMAEHRLGPVLDQQLADRMVRRMDLPIVDAVRNSLLGTHAGALAPGAAANGETFNAFG